MSLMSMLSDPLSEPDSIAWRTSLTLATPSLLGCAWPGVEWRPSAEQTIDRLLIAGQIQVEEHVRGIAAAVLAGLWSMLSEVPFALVPQAFSLPGGGLQMEWHGGPDHLEVSIEATGVVGLFASGADDEVDAEILVTRAPIPRVFVDTLRRITHAEWKAHPAR